MSICGEPDGEPTKYGVAIVDVCTGMLACNSILAALNARHRTGRGQQVEVSLYEIVARDAGQRRVELPRRPARAAAASATAIRASCRTRPIRAADGMIALAVGNDAPVRASSRTVLGHPEWASDPRFTKNRDRVANRDALDGMIAEALQHATPPTPGSPSSRPPACRAAASTPWPQALDDPHTAARDMVETVEHPTAGDAEDARHSVQVQRHAGLGAPRAADARPAHRRDPARRARAGRRRASPQLRARQGRFRRRA